jgi:hypothetical protein
LINPDLHKKPVALDRIQHRQLKVVRDGSALKAAAGLNAFFITVSEFGDACKEYPLLFLRAGNDADGKPLVAPVAVFGLVKGENLFFRDGQWNARYVPAMLRAYPFAMAPTGTDNQYVVCFDEAFAGLSNDTGEPLFDVNGEPTEYLSEIRRFVEQLETEVDRTRFAGRKLLELGLLQDKRFDATLPDGTPISVDGFLAVDEERMKKLSDAEALDLHRTGLNALLYLHMASMANMRHLLDMRVRQQAAIPS